MLLIHLDGLEWERAKWNYLVKLVLKMGWKLSVRYAKRLITDSLYVTNLIPIKHRPKAHLIRYGAEHLPTGSLAESPENSDYVLTIARAEPENKLELILKTVINDSAYTMVLISNAGHTRYGKKLIKKYGDHSRVKFVEAIYDNPALLQSYRFNCTLYIHGHSAGGTNPSLIEAMAAGIPVFAWDNPFNRETTYNMARYFHDRESLSRLIQEWSEQPDHDLGSRLRQITGESYQWDKVYEQLIEALK